MHDDYIEDIFQDRGTASSSVVARVVPAATKTAAALLTEDADNTRHMFKILGRDVESTHQESYLQEWQVLTQQRSHTSPVQLLTQLSELGFAWRHVAKMLGVSVPAIQKWRKGERLSGENRGRLTRLLAACEFIRDHSYEDDIASWFEMPISDGAPITPIDLWARDSQILFFDYLTGHLSPKETLDRFEPNWQEKYRSDFEVFEDYDGMKSIRMKDR